MADNYVRATLAGILLFAIGIAIGGGAIVNYQRERDALSGWQRADGEVVELVQFSGKVRPRIAFTANGERFRFTPAGLLADRSYTVGDTVLVLYQLEDPQNTARLESPAIRWARTVYAGVGGLALMVLGGYVAWQARRRGLSTPQLPNSTTPQ